MRKVPMNQDLLGYMNELFSTDEVVRFIGGPRDTATVERSITNHEKHWGTHGFGLYGFFHEDDFVGAAGLRIEVVEGKAELVFGIAILPKYWGRSMAMEMSNEVLRGQSNILAFTHVENMRSKNFLTKLGFKYERDGIYAGEPHTFYRRE